MINAHIKDAAAMCCYLNWLEQQLDQGAKITEISGADQLEKFRRFANYFFFPCVCFRLLRLEIRFKSSFLFFFPGSKKILWG